MPTPDSAPVVLPDCCEDFILAYGAFLPHGGEFSCPECATGWQKVDATTFLWVEEHKHFQRREQEVQDGIYTFLSAIDGHQPLVDRCCARLLLHYGPTLRAPSLRCPICGTDWTRDTVVRGGLSTRCFRSPRVSEPLAIQQGQARRFLIPFSLYTHPRD